MVIIQRSSRIVIKNFRTALLILAFVVLLLIFFKNQTYIEKNLNTIKNKISQLNLDNYADSRHANVKVVDLDAELEPKEIYENITCRKSKQIIVSTTLCVHDAKTDYISRVIMSDGIFEDALMSE